MVGKYVELTESYKSLIEALRHAAIHTSTRVNIEYIDSEILEDSGIDALKHLDAYWFLVDLASVALKEKFLQYNMLGKMGCLI